MKNILVFYQFLKPNQGSHLWHHFLLPFAFSVCDPPTFGLVDGVPPGVVLRLGRGLDIVGRHDCQQVAVGRYPTVGCVDQVGNLH